MEYNKYHQKKILTEGSELKTSNNHFKNNKSYSISNTEANDKKSNKNNNNSKIQSINYLEIEKLIKNANKSTLKKYNDNLDKRIKYLKFMNSQKYFPNNNINNSYNKSYISENDRLKTTQGGGESTFDNSENRNNIHIEIPNSNSNSNMKLIKRKNEKLYEDIINKNIPNNVYYKYRNKNMCFKLKKSTDKTIKNSLETILSKEDINLNYQKFKNSFLIINDCISILNNTKIKNTNNSFFKLISFLNNNEILRIFSVNREIRSCLIGCLAYKVKEKILPGFNLKYCKNNIFNDEYNFMILSKLYRKKKLHIRFILSLKPKITKINQKIINKRIKIGFLELIQDKNKYKIKDKIKVNTSYIFEVIEKKNPKNFWVFRENTSFHFDENNNAYYNDIMQFWPGDKTLININLISEMGIIDFDNFFWNEPKFVYFNKEKDKNNVNLCEVEQIVNEWYKIDLLENCEIVKKNVNDLFGQNFIIQEINYEDAGYFLFKIILKAYKIGSCSGREGNLGIKMNILPINSNITNEVKKNGLIFDENHELTVNVGDIIIFYISQNKSG